MADVLRYISANDVVNRAAVEVGLNPVNDVYTAQDPSFRSLRFLLDSSGQELAQEFGWNITVREKSFTTQAGDSGEYDLPDDFGAMIDQTQWQKGAPNGAYPLLGPASAQWWSYQVATGIGSPTLYAWFRIKQGKLNLWPQPPPVGVPIRYEYSSRAWVKSGSAPVLYRDTSQYASDIILYEPLLIVRKLKLAFLQAKGFDSQKAEDEFQTTLEACKGRDQASPVLTLDRGLPGVKFLDTYNVPETGYGPPS